MNTLIKLIVLIMIVGPRLDWAEDNIDFHNDTENSFFSKNGGLDLYKLCYGKIENNACKVDFLEIKVLVDCGNGSSELKTSTSLLALYCSNSNMRIRSSLPVESFEAPTRTVPENISKKENIFKNSKKDIEIDDFKTISIFGESKEFLIKYSFHGRGYNRQVYSPYIRSIKIRGVTHGYVSSVFRNPVESYISLLKYTLQSTSQFQNEIAASHQSHLDRYLVSLEDCLAILKDERNYTILDWRVQECSRRVVVFGVVLNELLEEYSHVIRLQEHINTITSLTSSVRSSYGWDRGLAGNASKATGALLEVIKFEIREILSIKISVGASNYDSYTVMIKEITKLLSKVNVSRAGDMAVQRNIWDFVDVWNTDDWQKELSSLISAPIDEKKLILPKLQLLLMAVESLNDLTNAGLEIPELEE